MSATCPTCGQPLGSNRAETTLLNLLMEDKRRDVYLGRDGSWYVTYVKGGGSFPAPTIHKLVTIGTLIRKWPETDAFYSLNPAKRRPRP